MNEKSNEQLHALDRSVVWHAFSQMSTYDGLIIESAEGCWLTDIHGKRYLDGASSLWCNVHGHRHPSIDMAIREQLDKVAHVTNLGMSHPTTITLAERLVRLAARNAMSDSESGVPHESKGLNHVFFCGDGASAIEVAMKIAFQYWRQIDVPQPDRTLFVALGSAYHGDTIGTVALGGVPQFHQLFAPLLFPVLRGPCPDAADSSWLDRSNEFSLRGSQMGMDDLASVNLDRYLAAYRSILSENVGRVAAVLVEPVMQCAAGMVMHPPGLLRGFAELCREYDTLLIVDEIAVGMGRTGTLFASELEGVTPDLLCLGKGLTGGYLPMSAALVSSQLFEAFLGDAGKTLYHGHTYGGNPLAAAAAHATLDLTEKLLASEGFRERQNQLQRGLKKLESIDDVQGVRSIGMLGAVELRTDSKTTAKQVCDRMLSCGVWLRPLGNTIPVVPPLVISEEELQLLLNALEYGLDPTRKVP